MPYVLRKNKVGEVAWVLLCAVILVNAFSSLALPRGRIEYDYMVR
jgi:hypothetical protein